MEEEIKTVSFNSLKIILKTNILLNFLKELIQEINLGLLQILLVLILVLMVQDLNQVILKITHNNPNMTLITAKIKTLQKVAPALEDMATLNSNLTVHPVGIRIVENQRFSPREGNRGTFLSTRTRETMNLL